jgi:hypothetical protein
MLGAQQLLEVIGVSTTGASISITLIFNLASSI